MAKIAVEQLLYLLDEAFAGSQEHSLLGNLRSVSGDDWLWVPEGGGRSIWQIAGHAATAKYVYANHTFGDGNLRWNDQVVSVPKVGDVSDGAADAFLNWAKEGHARFRAGVAALDDSELTGLRKAHWGEMAETRWLIAVIIEHDTYHAGEINHLRALRQGNDRWPGE